MTFLRHALALVLMAAGPAAGAQSHGTDFWKRCRDADGSYSALLPRGMRCVQSEVLSRKREYQHPTSGKGMTYTRFKWVDLRLHGFAGFGGPPRTELAECGGAIKCLVESFQRREIRDAGAGDYCYGRVAAKTVDRNKTAYYFSSTAFCSQGDAISEYIGAIDVGGAPVSFLLSSENTYGWDPERALNEFLPILATLRPETSGMTTQSSAPLAPQGHPRHPLDGNSRPSQTPAYTVSSPSDWLACPAADGAICYRKSDGEMMTWLKTGQHSTSEQIQRTLLPPDGGALIHYQGSENIEGYYFQTKSGGLVDSEGQLACGNYGFEFQARMKSENELHEMLNSFHCTGHSDSPKRPEAQEIDTDRPVPLLH